MKHSVADPKHRTHVWLSQNSSKPTRHTDAAAMALVRATSGFRVFSGSPSARNKTAAYASRPTAANGTPPGSCA